MIYPSCNTDMQFRTVNLFKASSVAIQVMSTEKRGVALCYTLCLPDAVPVFAAPGMAAIM